MQWKIIVSLMFSLIIVLLAVANKSLVTINYIFGSVQIPLIIVIVSSALAGGLIIGMLGLVNQAKLQWKINSLKKEITRLETPSKDLPSSTLSNSSAKSEVPTQNQ